MPFPPTLIQYSLFLLITLFPFQLYSFSSNSSPTCISHSFSLMDSNPPPVSHGSSLILNFSSSNSNFPILAISIIGILITALLLISYYIFVIKCCLNLHQIDHFHRFSFPEQNSREDPTPGQTPASLSRGLDESLIRLIPVTKFRKGGNQESEQLECTVCLSDFKQGENLRVIPNCSHTFHIDCIDVWLQSNASCPVCRSRISSNTLCAIDSIPKNSDPILDTFAGNDDDYVVIEIAHDNLADPEARESSDSEDLSTISITPSPGKAGQTMKDFETSFEAECIRGSATDDDLDRAHPIRRSVSMDSWSNRKVSWEIRKVLDRAEIKGAKARVVAED